MRRVYFFGLLLASLSLFAADVPWQYGRIESVRKSVDTKTKVWIVNTPITEDETTYTISVHLGDKILVGTYQLTPELTPPPEEWTNNYPVRLQVVADRLF